MTTPVFAVDPAVTAALAALHDAAVLPPGGPELACSDSTTTLLIFYAVANTLKQQNPEEMVRSLQALHAAIAVIATHLGEAKVEVRLPALRPTIWLDGLLRVQRDPKHAAVLRARFKLGMDFYQAIERDLALLAKRPGGTA